MEEKNTNAVQNKKNISYILVVLGLVLVAAAYFMVWSPKSTEIDDVNSEIDTLSSRKAELQALKDGEPEAKKEIKENNEKVESILAEYSGGITYQSQIMDTYNYSQDYNLQIPTLGVSPVTSEYQFAQGSLVGLSGDVMNYNLSATGSYDDVKKFMKDLTKVQKGSNARRKVMQSVSFNFDSTEQKMAVSLTMKEYAISGGDRKMPDVKVQGYAKSNTNIFYTEDIANQ